MLIKQKLINHSFWIIMFLRIILKYKEAMIRRVVRLAEAPQGVPLRIVEILGGHGIRRRLLALGFHVEDIIEKNSNALFGGPILVKNVATDTSVALGRGIAQKILVEILDGQN